MKISFEVNNQGTLELEQIKHDDKVTVTVWEPEHNECRDVRHEYTISPGDFITMLNWYCYQKSNRNITLQF